MKCCATLCAALVCSYSEAGLPPGFVEEIVIDDLTGPGGIAFSSAGRSVYWQYEGRVWTVDDGVVSDSPFLDLSEEVNTFWTRGMTGFAFDPEHETNGYIYLMYCVDWEWYSTKGEPNPALLDANHDTFGRLVRLTTDAATNYTTIVPGSRWEMIGSSHDNGFPITFASHTQNTIQFAPDGSMLLSAGDGASMLGVDVGGPRNSCCSSNTAETDGIITEAEQVGAYRSQLVNTHAGKILRIDPETALGLPDNPFFDADAPDAPRSRVYVLGLRNPYTFAIRPGTGGSESALADPGVLMIGDVGWDRWERLIVATQPGQNFGWPLYEGIESAMSYPSFSIANLDAPNPLADGDGCADFFNFDDLLAPESLNPPSFPNPCDPDQQIPDALTFDMTRPVLAWRNSRVFPSAFSVVPGFDADGDAVSVGITTPASTVDGINMRGVATTGGEFCTSDKWPAEYQGAFFFGDANDGWIASATFNDAHELISVSEFRSADTTLDPVWMTFDPDGYALYIANFAINPSGITAPLPGGGDIRRIVIDCNGNGVGDDIDIAAGTSTDVNGNGLPDECDPSEPANFDGDGMVGPADLAQLLGAWGPCTALPECPADLDGDGTVGPADLALLLGSWG